MTEKIVFSVFYEKYSDCIIILSGPRSNYNRQELIDYGYVYLGLL